MGPGDSSTGGHYIEYTADTVLYAMEVRVTLLPCP